MDGQKKAEQQRNAANNAETIRNAADVAIASKNPYGVAAGGAIKAADAVTGGKASELAGKVKLPKATPPAFTNSNLSLATLNVIVLSS